MGRVFIVMVEGTPYRVFDCKSDAKKEVEVLAKAGKEAHWVGMGVRISSQYDQVREVFLEWDPIGVRDMSFDEYDEYVVKAYHILELRDAGSLSEADARQEITHQIIDAEIAMFSGTYQNPLREKLIDKLLTLSTKEVAA